MHIALIGCTGYWGQKLDRVLIDAGHRVDPINSSNLDELDDSDADAAFVITPPETHFPLAMRAMKIGMDVLVAKPMTTSVTQAKLLSNYARSNGIVLMVDNTFVFTKSFAYLAALDEPLISYQSLRLSPPMPQAKINAAWDMFAHDFAILSGLGALGDGQGQVDGSVATCGLNLPSGGSAFMMASRAWPYKIREVFLHYPHESYLWTLDGIFSGDNAIVREDQESLVSVVSEFEHRCTKRDVSSQLSDGIENLGIIQALSRVFPHHTPFDGGRYAQNYKETLVKAT